MHLDLSFTSPQQHKPNQLTKQAQVTTILSTKRTDIQSTEKQSYIRSLFCPKHQSPHALRQAADSRLPTPDPKLPCTYLTADS
eukprot:gene2611-8101_t